MPYKNPEDKRKWEREHRVQRNAQRRMRGLEDKNAFIAPNPSPDRMRAKNTKSGWKTLIVLALGLGAIVLGAIGGSPALPSNMRGPNN